MADSTLGRRGYLRALAGGSAATLAGCSALESAPDAATTPVDDRRARDLANRFAPTLYFDADERWFPTDPRLFESNADGRTVVDGFDALDGYTRRFVDSGMPPSPTAFYHVVEYQDSPLAVVQYWFYSAFDQFTTNFHWHDWEALHVFLDTDSGKPQLYVASSHSRKVPNNEFLDPDSDRVLRILSELGSHSSALSLDDQHDRFARFPSGGTFADITNSVLEGVESLAELPIAYGLPRDEGARLPFLVPELDGVPLYDHEGLPHVDRSHLIDEALTIRSFDALASPPTDLPARETGFVLQPGTREGQGDFTYELEPTSEVEHISAFRGPQLSFEFSIPKFAEDAVASHITTTGVPWSQPRYTNPAADISDPAHRSALSDRYDAIGNPAPVNTVVALVTRAVTTDDAPENQGLTTEPSTVEATALIESEATAVPTFRGVAVVKDASEGEHRLTVNGAGVAPYSESLNVTGGGTTTAGVRGEIPLIASKHATKLAVGESERDLVSLAVEDDFAGRLYEAPLDGPDAVYVHRGGAYTTAVRDADDEVGAYRVDPADEDEVRLENLTTGKAVLATYLADVAEGTRAQIEVAADDSQSRQRTGGSENAVRGLATALGAVADAASRAAERAASGDRGRANENLDAVATRLERVRQRLTAARSDLPSPIANATERRLDQVNRRLGQARGAKKL